MTEQSMPNPADLYEAAVKNTREIVAGVKESQLNDSTPCTEWNVQTLMNHLLDGTGYATGALAGNEPQAAPQADSPAEAYDIGTSNVLGVMRTPGVLETKVQSPFGEIPAMEFAFGSFMDTLIHGWDLAKATGQNTELPAELVGVCSAILTPEALDGMRGGPIGPAIEVSDDASTQDKMIANFGRKP